MGGPRDRTNGSGARPPEADGVINRAWAALAHLAEEIGPRVGGSAGERTAARYLADAFRARGLAVTLQPFRFVGWEAVGQPRVEIHLGDATHCSLACAPMAYTDSTPAGGVSGRLLPAGVCELVPGLLEWPRYGVETDGVVQAHIAVVPNGRARAFPRPERQLLLEPIVIVGSDEFGEIAERLAAGEQISATVESHGRYVPGYESLNVIAELPGTSPETIVVSAHYDTVGGTPGAGDNASGVAGCLALAERFAGTERARSLRFIAWGAHEFGLLGSQFYVQDLAQRRALAPIQAAVALDILSDGDRLGLWVGPETLRSRLEGLLPELPSSVPIDFFPRGRGETDSWSFAERGIETVMLLTLPYPHFHLPEDTPGNNSRALFAFSVAVAERLLTYLLARSTVRRSPWLS